MRRVLFISLLLVLALVGMIFSSLCISPCVAQIRLEPIKEVPIQLSIAPTDVKENQDRFLVKHNLNRFTNISEVATNPFMFKGQKLALILQLQSMLSENKGMFWGPGGGGPSYLILSNIPSTLAPQHNMFFIAEVVGLDKETKKAHLKYILSADPSGKP